MSTHTQQCHHSERLQYSLSEILKVLETLLYNTSVDLLLKQADFKLFFKRLVTYYDAKQIKSKELHIISIISKFLIQPI